MAYRCAVCFWLLTFVCCDGFAHSLRAQRAVAPAANNALYTSPASVAARTPRLVRYDLRVSDTTWTIAGVRNHALATNDSVPAPTLTFTEGDTALIYVHNRTRKTVSFHWHGILLPNRYDGVPMLNTELIEPSQVHEFKFALKQHGTSWYHSHTRLNEQLGQYGAIVIYPPTPLAMPDQVVVLSDWTNLFSLTTQYYIAVTQRPYSP
ncbi:MAG: hypothetical protein EOP33_08865 [Rickettsiaceae bacterium]|nr:MAG: hypothetical protein EOP33_08865 [Rickettsiaceae bacterium]